MRRTLVTVLLLGALAGCASVSEVRTLGRYDFSYRIEGDARAAPLQIFDDGRQTYFQFREPVPAIFALGGDQQRVKLAPRRDGPYLVLDRIEREFVFVLDEDKAQAAGKYIGAQNRAVLPHELPALPEPAVPPPAAPPSPASLSRKIPFAAGEAKIGEATRNALEELLPEARTAKRVVILARPANGTRTLTLARAGALRDWLARRGVSRILIVNAAPAATHADHIELFLSTGAPADMTRAPARSTAHRPRPMLYGAAQPLRVSEPARPVPVDSGGGSGLLDR